MRTGPAPGGTRHRCTYGLGVNTIKNSFGRLPAVGLAVLMLAASLVWFQAGTARAAYDNCPTDAFCLFTESGGNGEMVSFSLQDGPVLDYQANAALAGKTFVSFRNNTSSWGCLYEGASYGGVKMQSVRPGHLGGDMPQDGGVQMVVPASHKFAKSKPSCRTGFERCQAEAGSASSRSPAGAVWPPGRSSPMSWTAG